MKKACHLALLLLALIACSAVAEDAAIARVFADNHVTGTMVISSLDGTVDYVHNDARARQRLAPASTFKIPNTLIALEEHVVASDFEVITWDSVNREVPAWNRDQTLRTAFQSSCLWAYQEFAKKIGAEKYRRYLEQIGYGNAEIGDSVTTFWLSGPLKIAATEQIAFLRKLVANQLPFSSRNLDLLKSVMVADSTGDYVLRCKTGWAAGISPQVGWFVGYVQKGQQTWLFAMNMDVTSPTDLKLRKEVTIAALKAKGIM